MISISLVENEMLRMKEREIEYKREKKISDESDDETRA